MKNETLLVQKSDFADVTLARFEDGDLAGGHIRVSVGPWALTANNVTYMVTGDQIGYWGFFDPKAYGLTQDGAGRMPVWGYAQVTESKCDGIEAGRMIYGFFPIAKQFDLMPTRGSLFGFSDGAEHRQSLHALYNGYTFVDADPSFGVHSDLQPVLRPLFTTSFLIDDFLAANDFFGAEQVLLLSASSKTALGTAFCLKQGGKAKVAALTSEGNVAFTKGTGFYDSVYSYDAITDMHPDVKTVVVDMSGNAEVLATVADHFEENLTYICRVGMSHWQSKPTRDSARGVKAEFFFAPDHAKSRIAEWGREGFGQKLAKSWIPFCDSAAHWLSIEKAQGPEAILENYKDLLNGQSAPSKGYLFTL